MLCSIQNFTEVRIYSGHLIVRGKERIMKNSVYSILFLITISLFSCKEPEPVQLRNIVFEDVQLKDNDVVEVSTILKVFNPNTFGATITDADLTVFINQYEITKINDIPEFSLPGKKESDVKLKLNLNATTVKNVVKKEWMKLFSGNGLNLIIQGDVDAKMGILSKQVKVDHSEDITTLIKSFL